MGPPPLISKGFSDSWSSRTRAFCATTLKSLIGLLACQVMTARRDLLPVNSPTNAQSVPAENGGGCELGRCVVPSLASLARSIAVVSSYQPAPLPCLGTSVNHRDCVRFGAAGSAACSLIFCKTTASVEVHPVKVRQAVVLRWRSSAAPITSSQQHTGSRRHAFLLPDVNVDHLS